MEGKLDSLGVALSSYSPEPEELAGMQETLVVEAREAVRARVLEASNSVVLRMRERFNQVFHKDENGLPRTWDVKVDIAAISKKGKLEAAQVLALFAVSMMDEPEEGCENATSTVCNTLAVLAEPAQSQGETSSEASGTLSRTVSLGSQFAMATWPGVEESVTLLSPARCRELWRSFDSEVMVYITQAVAAQDAAKRAQANGPPLWALLAIAFFGFDEFISVLYNPFYLVMVVLMAFVVKSVYTKLDVAAEMQMGLVPGLLAIYPKVVPALLSYLKDVAEKAQEIAEEQQKKHQEHVANNPPPPPMVAQMPAYNMTELSHTASSPVTDDLSATWASVSEDGLRRRRAGEE